MARLNVNESWWTDPRRFKLINLIELFFSKNEKILGKNEAELIADGAILKAWKVAQDFWKNGRKPVPLPVFMRLDYAQEIIESGLTRTKNSFIYVRGSKDEFEWLISARLRGKAGGESRARNLREKNVANSKQTRSKPVPSSSSSSSSSKNNTNTEELKTLFEEWGKTLNHFKIVKDPKFDEALLASLYLKYKTERVCAALRGMRAEARTDTFDPAKHCHLGRLMDPIKFAKFENLGMQAKEAPKYNREVEVVE